MCLLSWHSHMCIVGMQTLMKAWRVRDEHKKKRDDKKRRIKRDDPLKATFPANISIEKFCRFAKIIISFWSAKNLCVHEVRGRCTFFSKLDFSVVLRTAVSTVVPVKSKFEWAFVPSCHVNTRSSTWCWNCFAWRARRGGNSVFAYCGCCSGPLTMPPTDSRHVWLKRNVFRRWKSLKPVNKTHTELLQCCWAVLHGQPLVLAAFCTCEQDDLHLQESVFSATGGTAWDTRGTSNSSSPAGAPSIHSSKSLLTLGSIATCDDRRGTEKNFKKEKYYGWHFFCLAWTGIATWHDHMAREGCVYDQGVVNKPGSGEVTLQKNVICGCRTANSREIQNNVWRDPVRRQVLIEEEPSRVPSSGTSGRCQGLVALFFL